MAALGRRWTWRLWRVPALQRGNPAPRYVDGVAKRLTPELLDEIREFIDVECG